ncbi:hypothetical protein BJY04DRAFT_184951 [Aspergillus karnatakaensis]|uniref:uncharacterized protein n=1 Tax=Aspergillus karnatakaensis TaxID=1810916 RepID=UPI003CCCAF0E
MSRTCTEGGRHKQALEHLALAESLEGEKLPNGFNSQATALLNTAQMENFARLSDRALATANKAWETFVRAEDDRDSEILISFFGTFLELNQPDKLRAVLDYAYLHLNDSVEEHKRLYQPGIYGFFESRDGVQHDQDFLQFLGFSLAGDREVMYRMFHHALKSSDGPYRDFMIPILKAFKLLFMENRIILEIRRLVADILFEKGRTREAITAWRQIITDRAQHDFPGASSITWVIARLAVLHMVQQDDAKT